MRRVRCYIDGFNLYHAIHAIGRPHLKWVDLWQLASAFVDRERDELRAVTYFSAYATWLPGPYRRHREYVKALTAVGVTAKMATFYEKPRQCRACGQQWIAHEEKSTDVNAAIALLDDAYQDLYDRALLISRDSDLAQAVRLVRQRFPDKQVVIVAPPGLKHSKELARSVGDGKKDLRSIKEIHLERCLLPQEVTDRRGKVVATRPPQYVPPQVRPQSAR